MTRFWAEQVIMAQLQGSTELMSQLSSTLWGSSSSVLMAIRATTAVQSQVARFSFTKFVMPINS